jgi:hypothetical protein
MTNTGIPYEEFGLDVLYERFERAEASERPSTEFWYNAGENISPVSGCDGAIRSMPSFNRNLRE